MDDLLQLKESDPLTRHRTAFSLLFSGHCFAKEIGQGIAELFKHRVFVEHKVIVLAVQNQQLLLSADPIVKLQRLFQRMQLVMRAQSALLPTQASSPVSAVRNSDMESI
ncbi:hypothetical protein [Faecalispora jeddahensis]|uniref:hypothetical protein n=1 Tax=Faecalispora jeddahensis TaxID=1414721 RepID=UPI00145AE3ED|nr:hypothetical protein [Faecalispora jeddahensis]